MFMMIAMLVSCILMLSAGNLAVTFSANLARQLALLGPRQMTQRRAKEMLPEQLDIMLEKDDTMYFLYEARQRLEVSSPPLFPNWPCRVLLAICRALKVMHVSSASQSPGVTPRTNHMACATLADALQLWRG